MPRLDPEYAVAALVQRGVPPHVAQGVVMNFQDESGLNSGIQEAAPNVHGTRGYGLAQWTGPRRVALERYAQAQGKPVDDPEVQFDFFMEENRGPEAEAWNKVMAAPTAQDAAVTFVNEWERPAAAHAASRSSKYSGQGPGEGAHRFGGTGLGTPAAPGPVPDNFFTGAPPPGAPPTAQPGAAQSKALMGGLGSAVTGKAGQLPVSTVPRIGGANVTQSTMAPVASMDAQNQLRDQLSMAMARLNKGVLF